MEHSFSSFSLRDVLAVIRRNLVLILAMTVIMGALAFWAAQRIEPRYAATAKLISDADRSGLIVTDRSDQNRELDSSAATATIVETINTPIVLNQALSHLSKDQIALFVALAEIEDSDPPLDPQEREAHILRHLSRELQVSNSGRSFVVELRYLSKDPALAAEIANAVALGYLDYRAELRRDVYSQMVENLGNEIAQLTRDLGMAEQRAQTMREQVRLLALRSEALTGRQQDEAIAKSAQLYAQQREAEREAEAVAAVYERQLLDYRQIQSRIGAPESNVQLFAPATIPLAPTGFNAKPAILALGLIVGFLLGSSIALLRDGRQRKRFEQAKDHE